MGKLICIDIDYYIAASQIARVRMDHDGVGQAVIVTTLQGSEHLAIPQGDETATDTLNRIVAEVNCPPLVSMDCSPPISLSYSNEGEKAMQRFIRGDQAEIREILGIKPKDEV
jgi:hypothetical protein